MRRRQQASARQRSILEVLGAACRLILCVLHAGNPADYIAEINCNYGLLTLTAETKYTYFANPDGSIGAGCIA